GGNKLERLGVRFVSPTVEVEVDFAAIVGIECQDQPARSVVFLAIFVAGAGDASLPLVGLYILNGETGANVISQGATDEGIGFNFVETAITEVATVGKFFSRLGGNKVNGAAGGVLAKKYTLGTFEYF